MHLFLGKAALFVHAWWSPQDVLAWKMIACHHFRVQLTVGTRRFFLAFFVALGFSRLDGQSTHRS